MEKSILFFLDKMEREKMTNCTPKMTNCAKILFECVFLLIIIEVFCVPLLPTIFGQ